MSADDRKMLEVMVGAVGDEDAGLLRKVLLENPRAAYRIPMDAGSGGNE